MQQGKKQKQKTNSRRAVFLAWIHWYMQQNDVNNVNIWYDSKLV